MYKFNWNDLLSAKRLGKLDETPNQNAFDSDYKRIITSPAFRRLQDKTQVFPLERNDFVHTRLTHSIEVAMIARQLVTYICNYERCESNFKNNKEIICRIVENASLLHDIGNPPFGHFGEDIIREWFRTNLNYHLDKKNKQYNSEFSLKSEHFKDFINFEGNAQALRIVTKLHDFSGSFGMDLTCATLNTIMKYTRSSSEEKDSNKICDKKIGYFHAEQDKFKTITNHTKVEKARHPLAFILEASDDIAYLTADIEDAIEKNVATIQQFKEFMHNFIIKLIKEKNANKHNPSEEDIERYCSKPPSESVHLIETYKYLKGANCNINSLFATIRLRMIEASKFSFTKHYKEIMDGDFNQSLFANSHSDHLQKLLSDFAVRYIFSNKNILKTEISGYTILTFLLDNFIPAVILPEPETKLDKKLWSLIARKHQDVYFSQQEKINSDDKMSDKDKQKELLYHRLLMITDFISGMTDNYAQDLYLDLSGNGHKSY